MSKGEGDKRLQLTTTIITKCEGLIKSRGFDVSNCNAANRVGKGAYGFVYPCTNNHAKDSVIKFIPYHAGMNETQEMLVFDEARFSLQAKHSNIVRTIDAFAIIEKQDGVMEIIDIPPKNKTNETRGWKALCIVMEKAYCSLDKYVKQTQITYKEVSALCRDMLSALVYLISNKKLHRDIKPHNVLVFKQPSNEIQFKLCDFSYVEAPNAVFAGNFQNAAPGMLLCSLSVEESERCPVFTRNLDIISMAMFLYFEISRGDTFFLSKTVRDENIKARETGNKMDSNKARQLQYDHLKHVLSDRKSILDKMMKECKKAAQMAKDDTNAGINPNVLAMLLFSMLSFEPEYRIGKEGLKTWMNVLAIMSNDVKYLEGVYRVPLQGISLKSIQKDIVELCGKETHRLDTDCTHHEKLAIGFELVKRLSSLVDDVCSRIVTLHSLSGQSHPVLLWHQSSHQPLSFGAVVDEASLQWGIVKFHLNRPLLGFIVNKSKEQLIDDTNIHKYLFASNTTSEVPSELMCTGGSIMMDLIFFNGMFNTKVSDFKKVPTTSLERMMAPFFLNARIHEIEQETTIKELKALVRYALNSLHVDDPPSAINSFLSAESSLSDGARFLINQFKTTHLPESRPLKSDFSSSVEREEMLQSVREIVEMQVLSEENINYISDLFSKLEEKFLKKTSEKEKDDEEEEEKVEEEEEECSGNDTGKVEDVEKSDDCSSKKSHIEELKAVLANAVENTVDPAITKEVILALQTKLNEAQREFELLQAVALKAEQEKISLQNEFDAVHRKEKEFLNKEKKGKMELDVKKSQYKKLEETYESKSVANIAQTILANQKWTESNHKELCDKKQKQADSTAKIREKYGKLLDQYNSIPKI